MDPIADMLVGIKNAQKAGRQNLEIPFSKMKFALARILEREGFIGKIDEKGKKSTRKIQIILKYEKDTPSIDGAERVSKPGRRVYIGKDDIWPIKQGRGKAIISTSKGLMTDMEAKKAGLGGEILCKIW